MDGIIAVILVGGLGTRLRAAVSDRPKALVEIRGRPFLAYLFDQLIAVRIPKVVLCTGYMADSVRTCFGNAYGNLEIVYSKEETPMGTGGALRLALPHLVSDTVLVMNGDSYFDTNLSAYIEWFFHNNPPAALLLAEVDDAGRYGSVTLDDAKKIVAFKEKTGISGPGLINAGVYLMHKNLIDFIPESGYYSLEKDFFPRLTDGRLFGFRYQGRFIDIGTPQSYKAAEYFFGKNGGL
jgi:NDP-sugar pyrophosphorylase family protein